MDYTKEDIEKATPIELGALLSKHLTEHEIYNNIMFVIDSSACAAAYNELWFQVIINTRVATCTATVSTELFFPMEYE